MAARGVQLPKAQVARMMQSARQTMLDMKAANMAGYELRRSDPFERAKLSLQRAGARVFSHSLLVPGSTLTVVGARTMTQDEVIAHAERHGR